MKKNNEKPKENKNNKKHHFLIDYYRTHVGPTSEDLMRSLGLSPTGATRSYEGFKKETEEKEGLKEEFKYLEEGRKCYLKIEDKQIEIGKISTRKCKLLKCLFKPFGKAKTIDIVFGDIQLPKDRNNQRLWSEYLGRSNKETIIRTTGKEIQRTLSQKRSKRSLIFHVKNREVWLETN